MPRPILTRAGALLCALALAACQDDPTSPLAAPERGAEDAVLATGADLHDMDALPRFAVDVQVHGSFRPGTPVTVTATARGNLPTRDVELKIALPEPEVLRRGRGQFTIPTGVALPAAARRRAAIARGGEGRVVANAVLPGPGYYRVVATAQQRSDEPLVEGGRWVQGTVHRELWILVDEKGGRVTDTFDPSLLPENAVKAPGPIRLLKKRPEPRAGERPSHRAGATSGTQGARAPTTPGDATVEGDGSGFYTMHITFYNQDTGMYEPVAGAETIVSYYRYDDNWSAYVYSTWYAATDANGYFSHECGNPYGYYYYDEWYDVATFARNGRVDIGHYMGGFGGDYNWCESATYEMTAPSITGQVYARMTENMQRSAAFLGYSRPRIPITLSTTASNSSYTSDRITMRTTPGSDHVWGQWGQFVMAHELGHAAHEKALNGNAAGGNCPSPHYLNGAHNLACAYSEGFGNFHAAAIRTTELGYYYWYFQDNYGYPGQTYSGTTPTGTSYDGSIIEGAVAAFFLDLTDSDGEAHDQAAYPGWYLSQVIRTCEVYQRISFVNIWTRARGVDHLVHCLENQIDPAVTGSSTYFVTRSPDPTNWRESASEPYGSWNRWHIRSLWLRNLYGQ
jgi:hypothetical protein